MCAVLSSPLCLPGEELGVFSEKEKNVNKRAVGLQMQDLQDMKAGV